MKNLGKVAPRNSQFMIFAELLRSPSLYIGVKLVIEENMAGQPAGHYVPGLTDKLKSPDG